MTGGWERAGAQQPGKGAIDSHGSMCAADVLVAAPETKLYDYPFMVERSSGAIAMLNAVLDNRRHDGTPHILSNSWGWYARCRIRHRIPATRSGTSSTHCTERFGRS